MNAQKQGMLVPALIGGGLAGFLTAIPFVNCLCCIWVIGGGMLAAYLLSKNSQSALSTGDGAIVGIFAGIVAAVVDTIVSIPFEALISNVAAMDEVMQMISGYLEEMPVIVSQLLEKMMSGEFYLPFVLLGLVINAVIFSAFCALGGIIGVSLFKKKDIKPQEISDVP
jgi:hypothetical protein